MENKKLPCNTCEPLEVVTPQCKKYCDIKLPAKCIPVNIEDIDCIEKEEGQTEMLLQELLTKLYSTVCELQQAQPLECDIELDISTDGEGAYKVTPTGGQAPYNIEFNYSGGADDIYTVDGDTVTFNDQGITNLEIKVTDNIGCSKTIYYLVVF